MSLASVVTTTVNVMTRAPPLLPHSQAFLTQDGKQAFPSRICRFRAERQAFPHRKVHEPQDLPKHYSVYTSWDCSWPEQALKQLHPSCIRKAQMR